MVTGDEFRTVMRRAPASVSVITIDVEGQRLGLTVATLVSLSLDPPLVGFAIRRDAALHQLLQEAGELAVSVLAAGQEDLAQHFARGVPPIAMWEGIALRTAPGPPQLDGAAAWLRARLTQWIETGDHSFFVARVEDAEPAPTSTRPLVLHSRAYESL